MPYKEKEIEKIFFSIGEVATLFNVNPSLIRFYEKEFDILRPAKTSTGNRQFTKTDIRNFELIFHLVREKGFTIDGAKNYLKTNNQSERKKLMLRESLLDLKKFLLELNSKI